MDAIEFEKLLLKTAFSCMVCDGEVDRKEIDFVKSISKKYFISQDIDVEEMINQFIKEINIKGADFLLSYFKEIKLSNLTEQQELSLIDFALRMIYSYPEVKYSEIKFFKIIRSELNISNEKILATYPKIDVLIERPSEVDLEVLPTIDQFLEEDIITDKYVDKLIDDYLKNSTFPQFEVIQKIDNSFLENN